MHDFGNVYELIKEAIHNNAWIMLSFFYGMYLITGIVVAKVALFFADYLGAILAILAIVALYQWYSHGAGVFFLFAYPPAWTSWGVLAVCGRRWYVVLHGGSVDR